jgi:hypothetical protein
MGHCFDLISDLHIESWPQPFDWSDRMTSPWCIVAGDVARDRDLLKRTLLHLGECYQGVFYIDGNDEHHGRYSDLSASYREIATMISRMSNVVYLQDNVVIMDDVAILGTNGWWSFDFNPDLDSKHTIEWWCENFGFEYNVPRIITNLSHTDAVYVNKSLVKLQKEAIKHVIMVTHTVPSFRLIQHDIALQDTWLSNVMGNTHMMGAMAGDITNKIHTWCFGHYHGSIDQLHEGVRFVNNCRGRINTPWRQMVYNPRRIVIND